MSTSDDKISVVNVPATRNNRQRARRGKREESGAELFETERDLSDKEEVDLSSLSMFDRLRLGASSVGLGSSSRE